jgi:hypothetical protein
MRQRQTQRFNDLIPDEIWSRVIGIVYADAIADMERKGDHRAYNHYLDLLTVNRAWSVSVSFRLITNYLI